MKKITFIVVGILLSSPAFAIKKCKDAEGKWHYGDTAVRECESSKITTLNDRGVITDEDEAPLTDEEQVIEDARLAKEQAIIDAEKAERDEKLRILSIYETEADIDRLRDNQLNSVQGNIDVHNGYLKGMETRIEKLENERDATQNEKAKARIQEKIDGAVGRVFVSSEELELLKKQKKDLIEKFIKEKKIYRELQKSK